ncbi:MAG: RagB/SusD family nutrient uptake outer membrane protein [Sphingobacterium sp.]|jgi:hypothetical protein|nr:RagB/SusD family nutrient uptake outer membrane protein [Sphingobacterium sp.]
MKFSNKIFSTIAFGITILLFSGCKDYLDVSDEVAQNLTLEETFDNPNYIRRWHGGLFNSISEYSSIGLNKATGFSGLWVSMCGETTLSGNGFYPIISGFTSATANYHRWTALYQYIRDAHIFLQRVSPKGGLNDQYQITEEEVQRMKAEAKFLIAYSYFSLFEMYGPVPIVKEMVDPETKNLDFERASIDETVFYIDNLLQEVIASGDLPETLIENGSAIGNDKYRLNEIVRPTLTVALALRAKLWVYAASPLFNGGYQEALGVTNPDGKVIFNNTEKVRWTTAKKCLEDLFNNCVKNGHQLFKVYTNGVLNSDESIYQLFQNYNDEILWASGDNLYNAGGMEKNTNPRDLYTGWGYIGVSQNYVDAFLMKDGLTIAESNLYHEDGFTDVLNPYNENRRIDNNVFTMYANREPRFYAAIGYEGKSWHIQPVGKPNYTLGFAKGEGSGNSSGDNPRTGYLLTKFKNRKILYTGSYLQSWARPSILFRLADFYLYYAEVCNEINPSDPNIIKYLDLVRERAGIPGYQQLANTGKKNIIGDQQLQRKMIQRERQVELFAEGQRFFDIRRWMICEDKEVDPTVFYSMNMNGYKDRPIGAADSYFTRILLEKRAWNRAMYLYPIPQNEIQKSRLLVQNPLW